MQVHGVGKIALLDQIGEMSQTLQFRPWSNYITERRRPCLAHADRDASVNLVYDTASKSTSVFRSLILEQSPTTTTAIGLSTNSYIALALCTSAA